MKKGILNFGTINFMRITQIFLLLLSLRCNNSNNDYLNEMVKYYQKNSSLIHQIEYDIRNNVAKDYLVNFRKVEKKIKIEIYRRDSLNQDSVKLIYQIQDLKENDSVQLINIKFSKDFFNKIRLYLLSSEIKNIIGISHDNSVIMKYANNESGGIFEYELFCENVSIKTKSFIVNDCSYYKINDSSYIHYLYGFVGNRCILK